MILRAFAVVVVALALVVVAVKSRAATHERPERVTLPWSCEQIRNAAGKMTQEKREFLARVFRLSEQQKAQAARCLKEK